MTGKPGRPPSDNPASEHIRIRVTPEHKAHIQRRAAAEGLSVSAYMLQMALREPGND